MMLDSDVPENFKVVMLGESGVGKTSIVKKSINVTFKDIQTTQGAVFNSKIEKVLIEGISKQIKIKLHLWDTAGDEKWRSVAPIYYRNAHVVLLVYDTTNSESFKQIHFWLD